VRPHLAFPLFDILDKFQVSDSEALFLKEGRTGQAALSPWTLELGVLGSSNTSDTPPEAVTLLIVAPHSPSRCSARRRHPRAGSSYL